MSVVVHAKQQNVYGFRYLGSINNVLLLILTFGKHCIQTLPSTRHKAVGKETGKTNYPIALQLYHASTYCSISEKDTFVFQERARIILVLFGFLSTITINPYIFSTTVSSS